MNAHIHRSNLFLTYPTQTPLLHSGSRSVFPAVYMCTQKNDRIYMIEFLRPTPHPSATASPRTVFKLLIYCWLHKGVKDPVSFTVTTGLLGRLGLGLRVRVSIRIIFTIFRNLL